MRKQKQKKTRAQRQAQASHRARKSGEAAAREHEEQSRNRVVPLTRQQWLERLARQPLQVVAPLTAEQRAKNEARARLKHERLMRNYGIGFDSFAKAMADAYGSGPVVVNDVDFTRTEERVVAHMVTEHGRK